MKAEVDKLDIKKPANVLTDLKNLKIIVDDLNVVKLKTVPMDLKKLSDVVSEEFVKKTMSNNLNMKINIFFRKILDLSTLIQSNQYSKDKQSLLVG